MPEDTSSATPLALLHEAVLGHGVTSVLHADHILVDDGRLRLDAEVFEQSATAERTTITLEVHAYAAVLGDQPIVECYAGVGDTRDQAIGNAFFKTLLGSFHVIIETLTSHRCDEGQVEVESWRGPDGAWEMYTGPVLSQGDDADGKHLKDGFPEFFAALQVMFEDTVPPGPHWVRVFLGAFNGEHKGSEVLLDNMPWEGAHDLLLDRQWQWPEEYQSFRMFFIALPAPSKSAGATGWMRFRKRLGKWIKPGP